MTKRIPPTLLTVLTKKKKKKASAELLSAYSQSGNVS